MLRCKSKYTKCIKAIGLTYTLRGHSFGDSLVTPLTISKKGKAIDTMANPLFIKTNPYCKGEYNGVPLCKVDLGYTIKLIDIPLRYFT